MANTPEQNLELRETGRKILAYGKPHWKKFAGAFLLFTAGAAAEPVIPALFKRLIDSGFKEGLNYPLWLVPIVIIGLFLVRGLFNFAGNYAMTDSVSSVVLRSPSAMRAARRLAWLRGFTMLRIRP